MFNQLLESKLAGILISVTLAFSIILSLRQSGFLQGLELAAYDLHMQHRTDIANENPAIVLIRVYEKNIQQLKHYPLSDSVIADALEQLVQWEARVIGVDIFRDLPSEGRDKLQQVVSDNSNIVMIQTLTGDNPVVAPEFLQNQDQIGFADLKQDQDSVIRRGLMMMWSDDKTVYFSLSLQLALHYLNDFDISLSEDLENPNNVKLNNIVVKRFSKNDGAYRQADDGGYQYILNYPQLHDFPSYSIMDVLKSEQTKTDLQEKVKNKIVILGVTAESVQDQHETPFSSSMGSDQPMYGMVIHANAAQQLINAALHNQKQITALGKKQFIIGMIIMSFIAAITGINLTRTTLLAMSAVTGAFLLFVFSQLMFNRSIWIPFIPWALAYILTLLIVMAIVLKREANARKLIMNMFGKFVTPELADHLWQQRTQFIQDGRPKQQELTATILFADMQGYTGNIEKMTPTEALEWTNSYMSMMTEEAKRFSGLVDDYAGDGIKINFGVPVPRTKESEIQLDANNAVSYAQEIGKKLTDINKDMKDKGLPEVSLRIGIATGEVIAGSQGSSEHMKYTTLGDTVNIAARLESFDKENFKQDKENKYRILINENTKNFLSSSYQISNLGKHVLSGQKKKITVYSIIEKTC